MSATLPAELARGPAVRPVVSAARPHPLRLDIAHLSATRLLLYGWVLGLENSVSRAIVQCGLVAIELLSQAIRVPRPDVSHHFAGEDSFWNDAHGFYLLIELPSPSDLDQVELSVTLHSGETTTTRWQVSHSAGGDLSWAQPHAAIIDALLVQLPAPEAERLQELVAPARAHPAASATLHPRLRIGVDLCCLLKNRLLLVCGWLVDPAGELQTLRLECGAAH